LNFLVVMELSSRHCFPTDLNLLDILSVLFNDDNLLLCSVLFLLYQNPLLMNVCSLLVSVNFTVQMTKLTYYYVRSKGVSWHTTAILKDFNILKFMHYKSAQYMRR
jgi:hypothetical protein